MTQPSLSPLSTDDLIAEIQRVFRGVVLGDGIGLWQAQAIDDYEDEAEQEAARARDEKVDWAAIPGKSLLYCDSSLSFFDADGMRFHLPAFLLAEVAGEERGGGLLFHLTNDTTYALQKFATLSNEQRQCIVHFFKWCLPQERYIIERNDIERALKEDWRDA